jgi:hypothetical protein
VSNSITVWNSSVLAACPAPLLVGVPNAVAAVRVASLSADETPLPLPGTFVTPGMGVGSNEADRVGDLVILT